MSAWRSSTARPSRKGLLAQLRLEHPLLMPEVLPDRAGHGEAGAVGAAEQIDHVPDHGGHDLDVVRGHVRRPAQPVRGAEVGHAEAQGQDAVAVLVDGAGDPGEGVTPRLQMQELGRLQDGHREEAPPGGRLRGGERLQERPAPLLGEFRQYESGQQPHGGAEAAHEVGDLPGGADADEQQRRPRVRPGREVGELPDQIPLGVRHLGVVDRVLQAQHHRDDAPGRLLEDVIGEARPRGRAVERGPEGRREQAGRRVRGEVAGLPIEQTLSHLRGDMPEMTHETPPSCRSGPNLSGR